MIIKLIHGSETHLKYVGFLIRLSEQKKFMKPLILQLLQGILKSLINKKLSHDILC